MPTIKYKSNPNEDTAYCDGHKVQLVAVPSGTLQSPIHSTSDAGYVIDGNGEKPTAGIATNEITFTKQDGLKLWIKTGE